jgi:carbonic anhydrase
MSEKGEAGGAAEPSRRGLLKSLGIVAGGLVAGVGVSKVLPGSPPAPVRPKTAKDIAEALAEGNRRFASGASQHPHLGQQVRVDQAEKQTPFAAVLGCADSRVAPEIVFDQGVGDLFVVRVAGNIASADAVASLAYAIEHLDVGFIVVLGHESCGAVKATVESAEAGRVPPEFAVLVDAIMPAVKSVGEDQKDPAKLLDASVAANARQVAFALPRASGILKEAVEHRKLAIQAATYSLKTSVVTTLATVG